MSRFASTVEFYERFRAPYPAIFFEEVATALDITPEKSLIDLGTGPGLIALGFAPYAGAITAVDPEPAMLALARQASARASRPVAFVEGTAESLPAGLGPFEFVTIGRALHWMDPAPTRTVLDRLVVPAGAIAICASSTAKDGRNTWLEAYDALRVRWGQAKPDRSSKIDLPAFFAGTRFAVSEKIVVLTEQTIPVEDLVHRILSFSSTSPAILGDRVDAVLEEARGVLAPFGQDGRIIETVESTATIIR
ncbi:methyltransferase [Labrys miyagiensis]|uniref:Methyltransferase n=1 Tax=Labrys miyagiensis TaxID=346912 RepID=A0ABQ6CKS5_9HYPH|nr:class I SAM-dependent methyltransferase [Labrys miyagiensis]GLS19319.1 methyltransferase [Labrys miyagiensis]